MARSASSAALPHLAGKAPDTSAIHPQCRTSGGAVWLVADKVLVEQVVGSGPGLSLVRRIADSHQAIITLDAGENNQGLAVTVRFPPA